VLSLRLRSGHNRFKLRKGTADLVIEAALGYAKTMGPIVN